MTRPRDRTKPRSTLSPAGRRQPVTTCPECGKKAFTSKENAKAAATVLYPGRKMRTYNCHGTSWWHMTSQDAARTTEMRDRAAQEDR